jgi:hypothetical protein
VPWLGILMGRIFDRKGKKCKLGRTIVEKLSSRTYLE